MFNTNMPNTFSASKNAFPDDYRGSVSEQFAQAIASGTLVPGGDKDRAMKAVYEVVVGEGIGAGREAERLLPLGTDMVARVKAVRESLEHALEVFEHVANNVGVDT